MSLTPDQKAAFSSWVADGDSLSDIQKRLDDEFGVSLTYMEVRFLVDDLNLEIRDPDPPAAPKPAQKQDVPGPSGKKTGLIDRLKQAVGGDSDDAETEDPNFDIEDDSGPAGGKVRVEVDRLTRPGTVVSGNVTFSDGISGTWALDQLGRLMLDTGTPGYQPPAEDVQEFQRELSTVLQRQGLQ